MASSLQPVMEEVAEQMHLGSNDACEKYIYHSMNMTMADMQHETKGVPHFGSATIDAIYGGNMPGSPFHDSSRRLTLDDGNGKDWGLVPKICKDVASDLTTGDMKGKMLQDCVNSFVIENGEALLEVWMCDALTGGLGAALCHSKAFKAVTTVVNNFLNDFIEEPIIEVVDAIEDAVVSIAKKVGHWFHCFFSHC